LFVYDYECSLTILIQSEHFVTKYQCCQKSCALRVTFTVVCRGHSLPANLFYRKWGGFFQSSADQLLFILGYGSVLGICLHPFRQSHSVEECVGDRQYSFFTCSPVTRTNSPERPHIVSWERFLESQRDKAWIRIHKREQKALLLEKRSVSNLFISLKNILIA